VYVVSVAAAPARRRRHAAAAAPPRRRRTASHDGPAEAAQHFAHWLSLPELAAAPKRRPKTESTAPRRPSRRRRAVVGAGVGAFVDGHPAVGAGVPALAAWVTIRARPHNTPTIILIID